MKKIILIIVIVVVIAGIGFLAYYLSTQKKEAPANIATANANKIIANLNINKVPPPNYEKFSDGLITFDKVKEWTEISPQEIQKALTEEQRQGYEIIYYSANNAGVVLSVSRKSFGAGTITLAKNFEDDIDLAQKQSPTYKLVNKKISAESAESEATVPVNNTTYIIYSKAVMKNISAENKDWYYFMQISVPTNFKAEYSDVTRHLLDSLL